ncbi:hypothetical protein ATC00_22495 [Sinorhizobium americanum]|nr:hypothetical protein ATC00_22495 [Sinorhizobium americanum]
MTVSATNVLYIKLGRNGEWENASLKDGELRFGYHGTPQALCVQGDWQGVWAHWNAKRSDPGAATRDMKQIRAFYEADAATIFVTFAHNRMYWCQPSGPVHALPDGSHSRKTVSGWSCRTLKGVELRSDRLSGRLLKVQMFRGTICDVGAKDYVLRRINDELSPEVAAAEEAERVLMEAIVNLMRLLTWQDFELLIDLVFSSSGWRRVSAVGKTQKTIDLELMLPTTGERAFVQVKSQASLSSLEQYVGLHRQAETYDRMFFVWHTGDIPEDRKVDGVTLLGPQKLSRMILDTGLSSWLREKVS